MAVSRRLRFEILKRDGHVCRYCGAAAPDVPLTVDHVTPVALGGKDDPTNLVTACRSCNSGKSSVSPDAAIVADVDMRAALWAKASELASERRAADREAMTETVDAFDDAWCYWTWGPEDNRQYVPRTPDWETTVAEWVRRGLSVDELTAYIPRVMRDTTRRKVAIAEKWTYFCGIAWKLLAQHEEETRLIAEQLRHDARTDNSHVFQFADDIDGETLLDDCDIVAFVCGDQFIPLEFDLERNVACPA